MTRSAVAAAVAVLAGAAAAGVLLLGRTGAQGALPPDRPLTVRAVFDAPAVQFGDRLDARVVVLLDRATVRVDSLRIVHGFAPLTQLGPERMTRTRRGRLAVVSIEVPASCLAAACAGASDDTPISLPPVTVQATTGRGDTLRATAHWPVLHVTSRVASTDLEAATPPLRGDALPPPPTYRIGPGTLANVLEVLAAFLTAAGVGLAAWEAVFLVRGRRSPPAADELELALLRLRQAEAGPAPDRRRAVGLLARLLGARARPLAGAASELAWSEPTPEPEALSALGTRIERQVRP
jgi:hypothetical protein